MDNRKRTGSYNSLKKIDKKIKAQVVAWYDRRFYVYLLLVGLPALVYFRSVGFEFTMLDDSIFIKENQVYNSDFSNIGESFKRGLFNPTGDFYYRPVFLVDFILESALFGTNPAGYHFTNLLFHILCVVLLYLLLKKLKIPPGTSLVLALIFAVHPVLSQAVAWIPGRNDMLLMIFFLTGLLLSMKYAEAPRWYLLAGQFMFILLALFTKETAVIIPVIILAVLMVNRETRNPKPETRNPEPETRNVFLLLLSWTVALAIWFLVRSNATLKPQDFTLADLVMNGISRSPALLQYLGKIFFPFNLAVFPAIEHITLWWGLAALVILTFLVVWSGSHTRPLAWIGAGWYVLFLVPVLVVPASLNDQVFEHRLYLPIVGVLLVISQVNLNSKFKVQMSKFKIKGFGGKGVTALPPIGGRVGMGAHPIGGKVGMGAHPGGGRVGMGAVTLLLLLFSVMTYARIGYFRDPVIFWTTAVEGNPTSAYAHMMLGLRMTEPALMKEHFDKAYRLNPDEKMLNYLIGKLALDDNDIPKAEMHLKQEIARSDIPDNYFNLARIYFMKNNLDSAAWCLENVIRLDPTHPQANHNLLLLYLQGGKKQDAGKQVERMRALGLEIPAEANHNTP